MTPNKPRILFVDDERNVLDALSRALRPWQARWDMVFHDHVRTRGQADAFSGRGVGLAAVRAETERLGGRVSVRSRPGMGTRFLFDLPVAAGLALARGERS